MASDEPSKTANLESQDDNNIAKLKALLKSKDDTQRFVGLALLKSLLDNTPEIRNDEAALRDLWSHISPKFLDRLLRTGSNPSNTNAKDMLDIGVSILYTFSVLLPGVDTASASFTDRVPSLVAAALYSKGETTRLLLQLLYTLVNSKDGAAAFMEVEDTTPLTEIATSHAMVLDIFCRAWLNNMASGAAGAGLSQKIEAALQNLVVLFKGTDAVTYLAFLGTFLSQATPEVSPKVQSLFERGLMSIRLSPRTRNGYRQQVHTYSVLLPAGLTRKPVLHTQAQRLPFCKHILSKHLNFSSKTTQTPKSRLDTSSSTSSSLTSVHPSPLFSHHSTPPNTSRRRGVLPLISTSSASSSAISCALSRTNPSRPSSCPPTACSASARAYQRPCP